MKLRTVMIFNAIVATIFGLAFLFLPGQVPLMYGVTPDAVLRYMGQLFGVCLIGFAFLTWGARDASDSDARRAIVFALFISNGAGFIVALIGQLRNVVNVLGWLTVVIYLLLALGFGYFQFRKPAQ
jgi:hypothetical protein